MAQGVKDLTKTLTDKFDSHIYEAFYEEKKADKVGSGGGKSGGFLTEKDIFFGAKQILVGILIVFLATLMAYVIRPEQGAPLVEICKTALPPLVTLILTFYFKN